MRVILGLLFSESIFAACLLREPGAYCGTEIIPLPQGDMTEIRSVPNSDWLLGVTTANGQKDIFALNSKNFDYHFLTQNSFDEDGLSFSPDGKRMVYISREKDPLGDIVTTEFTSKKIPKLAKASLLARPSSQESSPAINGSKLVFLSRNSSDQTSGMYELNSPKASLFQSLLKDNSQKISDLDLNPVLSQDGKVFFSSKGSISYVEHGKINHLIAHDGFLRRALEIIDPDKLRYLRYSFDSNGDGIIDARDASELVELSLKSGLDSGLDSYRRERVLLYKSNQIAQFTTKNRSLYFSERTNSGYVITKNDPKELSCDLSLATSSDHYENYISLCSEKDFGGEASLLWRFYIRNHSLKGLSQSISILKKVCQSSNCSIQNCSSRLFSSLKALTRATTQNDLPTELVVDWGLRSNQMSPAAAFIVFKNGFKLSPYTLKRLLSLVSTEPKLISQLKDIAANNPNILGYMASLEIAKQLASIGKTDLALNEAVSILSRFKSLNIDLSEAIELAGKYTLAAKLRGFMTAPLTDLLLDNRFDTSRKELSFHSAAKTLVLEGSNALEEGQIDQAKASFELALKFDPNDLRAVKELSFMGVTADGSSKLTKLIDQTYQADRIKQSSQRREFFLDLRDRLKTFSDKFYFESEFHIVYGWLNYQIYLTEKSSDPSFGNWWYGELKKLKKVLGFSNNDYLIEAKDSLERAESIELSKGQISERLSQNLAIVMFEIGDFKKALRYALKRIEGLDSLEFSDAEVGHYFLSLASSSAGKLDEYALALQLASESERIAEKTNSNNLEKIKRAKVYLFFQNGDFAPAAREITQIFSLVKMSELETVRLKVLRAWFYKLSGQSQLASSSVSNVTSHEQAILKNSKLSSHYSLLRWLQRELATLPKDEAILFGSLADEELTSGYFERSFDKALGKNQAFSDRAKKSLEASQRFLNAGLNTQALAALMMAENDIKFLAGDVDNREAPGIIGHWLDLRIVLSLKDQGTIDQLLIGLLKTTEKSCDKLENSKKNKNCLAITNAISGRESLRSFSYKGPLLAHSARSFLWTNSDDIIKYSEAESKRERRASDWIRLISAGEVYQGLLVWSQGVLTGELREFDLLEIDEYYGRLNAEEKKRLDQTQFRFARIIRVRQKFGLETETVRDYFRFLGVPRIDFSATNLDVLSSKKVFGLFSGELYKSRAIFLDPMSNSQKLVGGRMTHEIMQSDLIKFIPMIYDLNTASISDFLLQLEAYQVKLNPPDPDPAHSDMTQALARESLESSLIDQSQSDQSPQSQSDSGILEAKSSYLKKSSQPSSEEPFSSKSEGASSNLIGDTKDSIPTKPLSMTQSKSNTLRENDVATAGFIGNPRKEKSAKDFNSNPNIKGQALLVCGFSKNAQLREFDEIFARAWDIYEGRVYFSRECEQSEETALADDSYFDEIDNQLDKSQFFDAWNQGLASMKIDKVDADLWDSFARELVAKGHYWGAYVVYDLKRYFFPESLSASLSGMATMAFFEKNWDLARLRIDDLTKLVADSETVDDKVKKISQEQGTHHPHDIKASKGPKINSLEIMRMKAVLAENTLDPGKVALSWQELIDAAQKIGNDTLILRGLNSLGNYYLDKAFNPAAARESFQKALGFAKSKQMDGFDASFGLAMADMRTNSFNKALDRLYQLEGAITSDSNPLMKLRLNQQISSGLLGLGKLSQSLQKLSESNPLIAALPSSSQRNRYEILKLNLEGMIYGRQGWKLKARETFSKALDLAKISKFNDLAAIVNANQGFWYRVFGQIDLSLVSYKEAMALSAKTDLIARASDLRNIGLANLAGGKLGLAELNLNEAEELSITLSLKQNLGLSRIGLAQIHFSRSQWPEALRRADEAVKIFSEDFLVENYARALFGRAMILDALGRKGEAESDLLRAVLINFKSYPGQRVGHSPQELWVDLTIRDIFDVWLERYGADDPRRSLGLMAFWQRRQTVDRLLTIDSAQSKLLEPLATFSGNFLENPNLFTLSDKEIKAEIDAISQRTRQQLPRDLFLLWSLKHSVIAMHFPSEGFAETKVARKIQLNGEPNLGHKEKQTIKDDSDQNGAEKDFSNHLAKDQPRVFLLSPDETPVFKFLAIDRKNFLRYGNFSERLLEFMGDTELFSRLWYGELLKPFFGDLPPKSIAFLISDEFDDFPLELLAPASSHPIAVGSEVRRLMGGIEGGDRSPEGLVDTLSVSRANHGSLGKNKDKNPRSGEQSNFYSKNGFLAGSRFKDRDSLPLVEEETKVFRTSLGDQIYLNAEIPTGSFQFLQVSGHFYLERSEIPRLDLGPRVSLEPSQMLEKIPPAKSVFFNICGVKDGSQLLRAIASLRGARQIIDANGNLSEISSFTMSKELLPRIASGQELSKALQDSRAIISQKGKHPSYWVRFRHWDIF